MREPSSQGLPEGGRVLTARSSMSIVTASSASTCTVESAWTVTEPLLTATAQQRGPRQAAQEGLLGGLRSGVHTQDSIGELIPGTSVIPLPEQNLSALL